METDLDFTQLRAFTAFKRGYSVALLGGAGSGKTFLLSRILQHARDLYCTDKVIACAWTNQAASGISGRTIHSWLGVTAGFHFKKEDLWEKIKKKEELCKALRNIEVLFIDEVSFLKDKIIDSIDHVMRLTASTKRLACMPMGGRQIVLSGDPFQLEPISVDYSKEGEKHVFSSRTWLLTFGGFGSGVIVLLRGNHRQKDDRIFYQILSRMRQGNTTEEDISCINNTGRFSDSLPRSHTVLCLHRAQVEAVNKSELALIAGEEYYSRADDTLEKRHTEDCATRLAQSAPKFVCVKIGCDIILTRKIGDVLPGTRVTVVNARRISMLDKSNRLLSLDVRMDGKGDIFQVEPMRFEVYDSLGSVLAVRTQLPIVSAYALTIHRAQGLSLRRVAVDFRKIRSWVPTGLTYVALSRCKSMDGLWAQGLENRHITVNPHARRVMEDIMKLKSHFIHRVISSSKSFLGDEEWVASHDDVKVGQKRTCEAVELDYRNKYMRDSNGKK